MAPKPPLTVLIADDNGLFATALEGILEDEESVVVVGHAADGEEAVRLAAELGPDVVLMDLSMPRLDGFEATRLIRANTPDTAVVVLTGSLDSEDVERAKEAGARGFVTKDRILARGKDLLPLPPKAVDTLVVLVESAGKVVSRDELLRRVWPDSFVEPNNLAQQVSMVREALGDRGARPQYVETVSRRGYRFVAPVTVQEESAPAATPSSAAIPEVRYTRSGNVNIAYQVVGDGPIDLVFVMGWVSHLEYFWKEPSFARFLNRLASFSRLILFDKRGTGLSDRVTALPTLEERMDDVRAVMEAVGSERAALLGVSEGGPMCSLFAATYPEKTSALVMIGTYAKRVRDDPIWIPD